MFPYHSCCLSVMRTKYRENFSGQPEDAGEYAILNSVKYLVRLKKNNLGTIMFRGYLLNTQL